MEEMNPNIIWIVWDTCRSDFVMNNHKQKQITPNLNRLANDSIKFNNAFSAAPWTPPSHASMFTGEYPSTHRYLDDGMELNAPHIAETLSQTGYNTALIASPAKLGSHTPLSNGFDSVYETFRLPSGIKSIEELNKYYYQVMSDWLKFVPEYLKGKQNIEYISTKILTSYINKNSGGDPFFVFINYLTPHSPYDPPEPYQSEYTCANDEIQKDIVEELSDRGGYKYISGELSASKLEWEEVQNRYVAEIAYADSLLGKLLEFLEYNNMYDDTMIIFTSDHGEHFGEHNLAYHQFSLYDELLQVPLLIKLPNNKYSHNVDDIISLIDIYPTIIESTKINDDESSGVSLLPSNSESREAVFAEYGKPKTAIRSLKNNTEYEHTDLIERLNISLQCIRTNRHKLIIDSDDNKRLFDLESDPNENENLYIKNHLPQPGKKLEMRLQDKLSRLPEVDPSTPNDREVHENLEALGYR